MSKVIVIGGGWSGIAAAVRAKKQGAEVTITEKTDLLLGLGNVGAVSYTHLDVYKRQDLWSCG